MKIIIIMTNVVFWSFLAQQFCPWWIIAIVCFVVAYIMQPNKFTAFSACLISIFVLWTCKAWYADGNFDVPMSTLLGSLLGKISDTSVYFLTGLIGGLVAGLTGLLGTWTRSMSSIVNVSK